MVYTLSKLTERHSRSAFCSRIGEQAAKNANAVIFAATYSFTAKSGSILYKIFLLYSYYIKKYLHFICEYAIILKLQNVLEVKSTWLGTVM